MAKKKQSKKQIRSLLKQSLDNGQSVHIRRTVERHEREHGIVLGLSDEWVLVASIRDGAYLDGYRVFRVGQLRHVEPMRTFDTLLQQQEWWPLSAPARFDLTSPRTVIESAAEFATFVMIFEEVIRPGICLIGVPVAWRKKSFGLHNLNAQVRWDDFISKIAYKDVSQVGFASDYEKALMQVAGDRPTLSKG